MKRYRPLVPVVIAVFYFLVFGRYGFGDTDEGFITGLAWRVARGEKIYRDFIYVRPPLTVLIHAGLMKMIPIDADILLERALFYVLVLIYSYLATSVLQEIFPDDRSLREQGWLYTSAFLVFSIHNFSPPFAWHTIDGIFFAVAGIWLLVKRRPAGPVAAAVAGALFVAAALTKQSFYVVPLLGGIWLCVVRRRFSDIVAYFTTCGLCALTFIFTLRHLGMWSGFILQTTGSTDFRDALNAGVQVYLSFGALYLSLCLILVVCIRAIASLLRWPALASAGKRLTVFLGVFVVINVFLIANRLFHGDIQFIPQTRLGYSQAMFLVACWFAAEELRKDRARGFSFILLLAIAWCASISWGYLTPLFFAPPLIYGVVRLSSRFGDVRLSDAQVVALILCVGAVIFCLCDLFPYQDLDGRLHDRRDLGKLAPRLSGIMGGDQDYSRLEEFLQLEKEYGSRFITLPAFPASHFLTGTLNPAPIDWALNAEMAHSTETVFRTLDAGDVYALVDIRDSEADTTSDIYGSNLTKLVESRWRLLKTGSWYKVYAAPKYATAHDSGY